MNRRRNARAGWEEPGAVPARCLEGAGAWTSLTTGPWCHVLSSALGGEDSKKCKKHQLGVELGFCFCRYRDMRKLCWNPCHYKSPQEPHRGTSAVSGEDGSRVSSVTDVHLWSAGWPQLVVLHGVHSSSFCGVAFCVTVCQHFVKS